MSNWNWGTTIIDGKKFRVVGNKIHDLGTGAEIGKLPEGAIVQGGRSSGPPPSPVSKNISGGGISSGQERQRQSEADEFFSGGAVLGERQPQSDALDYLKNMLPKNFQKYVLPKASEEEIAELRKIVPHLFFSDGAVLEGGPQPASTEKGYPYLGNKWKFDPSRIGLFGRKRVVPEDEQRRRGMRINPNKPVKTDLGFFDHIMGGAKNLFEDPTRMALLSGGLSAMDPNSYYDKQGFYSPWTGLQAGLGTGIRTYKKLGEPRKLGFKEQEQIKHENAMALERSKYRKPLNLDSKDSYMFSRARKLNPNVTPEDIASDRFKIPLEWHLDFAKINAQSVGTTYEQEFTKNEASSDLALKERINESADAAHTMDAELDSQFAILNGPKADELFGPLADWKMYGKQIWEVTGIPDNSYDITTYELFQKSTMEMLLEQLRKQKGPQTEGDAKRALKTLPNINNTVLGSKYIVAMKKAVNARAIAKQRFMDKYIDDPDRGNGYPKGLGRAWARSDVGGKSIFQWIADLGSGYSGVLVELYDSGILTGPEMKKIVFGME